MKLTAIKTQHGYAAEDSEVDAKIPFGSRVMVEYTKGRNYDNHKRFFAFIGQTFDMQEFFDDKEVYRKWLTMKAGYFQSVVTKKGETLFWPESIAFEKMGEPEFKELFSKCINVFINEFETDLAESQISNIVYGYG